MNLEAIQPVLQFTGFCILLAWLLTGIAIWLRWGWVGIAHLWKRRNEIDQEVERDLKIRTH
jgi:hypothetical protein